MSSVPDGRAANQPLAAITLMPPIGASLPGARSSTRLDRLAGELRRRVICSRRQLRELLLLRRRRRRLDAVGTRCAELVGQRRDTARAGSRPVRAVISAASSAGTMPSLSVVHAVPSRRRNDAPALSSPPKPSDAVQQAVDEPFEADRHLVQPAAEPRGHAVDHRAADDRLADRRVRAPLRRDCGTDSRSPPPDSGSAAASRREA